MIQNRKKAIIIGASSGIGRALAKVLAQQGYDLGLAAPNFDLLQEVQKEIPSKCYLAQLDLNYVNESLQSAKKLFLEMGDVDLFVVSAGISLPNPDLEWEVESEIMRVNAIGFMAMANVAVKHFLAQGYGHLVGISSICGLLGGGSHPAYYASKACMSSYLSGLRQRLCLTNITVTDIRPGYVKTAMIRDTKGLFWLSTPEEAAKQIFVAIRRKKKAAYITARWALVAIAIRLIPGWLYERIYRHFRTT